MFVVLPSKYDSRVNLHPISEIMGKMFQAAQVSLVFPISNSFMVKKRLEIERRKSCGPYIVGQITTLQAFLDFRG